RARAPGRAGRGPEALRPAEADRGNPPGRRLIRLPGAPRAASPPYGFCRPSLSAISFRREDSMVHESTTALRETLGRFGLRVEAGAPKITDLAALRREGIDHLIRTAVFA